MRCVGTYPCTGPARGHTVTHAVRLHSALAPRGATPSHMRCVGTLRSPARLHAALVLEGVTPLGNSTLAGAATRRAGSQRVTPWAPLRSPVRLHAALVLEGVTPLGNSPLAGAATRCAGSQRGHTPGQLSARRCGYTLRRFSTGSHPRATLRSPVRLALTLDGVTPLGAALDVSHVAPSQVCALDKMPPPPRSGRWAALFVLRYGALLLDVPMTGELRRRRTRSLRRYLRRYPLRDALAWPSRYR